MGAGLLIKETFGYAHDGFFAEIGAFNGVNWSDGHYCYAELGWSGVMVEPDPTSYALCADYYKDSKVQVIQKAAGGCQKKLKLYRGGTLSTCVEERVDLYNILKRTKRGWGGGKIDRDNFVEVDVDTLDNILRPITDRVDVLSIDVEGMECEVISGMDFDYFKPKIVVIETHEGHEEERLASNYKTIDSMMAERGYNKYRVVNCVNTIYMRK